MIKVEVVKFQVSNATSGYLNGDEKEKWYQEKLLDLHDSEDITESLNYFIEDKDVIDIKVNTVDIKYHNNGRGNTIELWYTIIYRIN